MTYHRVQQRHELAQSNQAALVRNTNARQMNTAIKLFALEYDCHISGVPTPPQGKAIIHQRDQSHKRQFIQWEVALVIGGTRII